MAKARIRFSAYTYPVSRPGYKYLSVMKEYVLDQHFAILSAMVLVRRFFNNLFIDRMKIIRAATTLPYIRIKISVITREYILLYTCPEILIYVGFYEQFRPSVSKNIGVLSVRSSLVLI